MFDIADKFIELVNEMSKTVRPGDIGVAIRYAAARYSAFDASLRTKNMAEEKVSIFVRTFTEMLQENFEQYSKLQFQKQERLA
jgi:hypothetical protein